MRHTALRSVRALRTTAPRRLASSSSSPAGDNAAAAAQKKAQDALGAASAAAARAGEFARSALGPLGARLSGLLGSYQQPVRYNLSVAREVLKHVYTAERLQPPTSLGAVFGTYGTLWGRARSVAYWRQVVASGEWARLGVYAVEAYGIFKIGEIVGRRSLVGYNVQ
ncbi:hypothetical protein EDB83DRAFT_2399960 [Lactarius deliciosus]|nr:hypothetical protein EDB83DRAFT_2399960 [Lactarius deliciosus]